jgi:alkanesulfonate monooxygenase SsuD/methylene tetrahydromethanopterin reductase-like flavin-dependent oxidoreductase (luciferase family)
MLRLAGEVGDGAWVNFLPLSAAEQVVGEVRAGEQAAGREPGSVDIVCRFFNVPAPFEEGLPFVRFMFAAYATVPVYAEYFRWLGFAEQIDPMVEAWEAKDREAAIAAAPWELIEDTFVLGTPEQMRERLDAYVEGGITLPILTPVTMPDRQAELVSALAPG